MFHYVSAASLARSILRGGDCQGGHGRQPWYKTLSCEPALMPAGWGKYPWGEPFTCWLLASRWPRSTPSRLPRMRVTGKVCFLCLLAGEQWPGFHTLARGWQTLGAQPSPLGQLWSPLLSSDSGSRLYCSGSKPMGCEPFEIKQPFHRGLLWPWENTHIYDS